MARAPRARAAARDTADTDRRALELTRQLAALLNEHGLAEVEMEARDLRLRVQRTATGQAPLLPAAAPAPVAPALATAPVATETATNRVTIEAPMVGTFYRASSPTADPYVREGDTVKEGQILCIIEAMKLMNEIESRVAGRVVRILVENGQPVEYGQALFLIEPQR